MNTTKHLLRLVSAAGFLSLVAGCGSVYTNIEKTGENTYLITRTKQGLVPYGTLFQCQARGDTQLDCKEVGSP